MAPRPLAWVALPLILLATSVPRTAPSTTIDGAPAGIRDRQPGVGHAKNTGGTGPGFVLLDSETVDGGSGADDESRGIAVDAEGNVWVTGYVSVPGHGRDIWLAKYDPDLGYLDSTTVNGEANGDDEGYLMAFDHDGSAYLVGYMTVAGHDHDIWIGKFDADLVLVKSITINGSESGTDDGYGILYDEPTGLIYAAGTLRETGQGSNAWIASFNTDLVVQDTITLNGPIDNTDKARFMAFDDARHLFASGSVTRAVTDYDIWIGKFEADLTFIDEVIVPGPSTDEDKGYGIVFGGAGTLFVTGTEIEPPESYNIWLAAFDTDLDLLDEATINGPVDGEDVAYLMTMDGVGRLYHTGVYTEADGGSNIWLASFDSDLALQSWTTVDGPAGAYDTGMGVATGPNADLYVSAVVSDPDHGFDIWIGHFAVPTLFVDGLESGGTGRWTVATAGATRVSAAAARTGAWGLEVDVSPPCGPAHDVLLRDMTIAGPLQVASCATIAVAEWIS